MIRKATHDDVDAVVAMGARFYETTTYKDWSPFCPDSSRTLVEMVVDEGVLLIAEEAGKPVGMVGLVVAPFFYNRALKAAYEVFWWVEPHARGGLAAWRLLKGIEPACRELGCASIQMTMLSSSPDQARALYERAGYRHTETSFTKVIGKDQTWQ